MTVNNDSMAVVKNTVIVVARPKTDNVRLKKLTTVIVSQLRGSAGLGDPFSFAHGQYLTNVKAKYYPPEIVQEYPHFEAGDTTGWSYESGAHADPIHLSYADASGGFPNGEHFAATSGQNKTPLTLSQAYDIKSGGSMIDEGALAVKIEWAINTLNIDYTESAGKICAEIHMFDGAGNLLCVKDSSTGVDPAFFQQWELCSEVFTLVPLTRSFEFRMRYINVNSYAVGAFAAPTITLLHNTDLDSEYGVSLPINGDFYNGDVSGWIKPLGTMNTVNYGNRYSRVARSNYAGLDFYYDLNLTNSIIAQGNVDSGDLVLHVEYRCRADAKYMRQGLQVAFMNKDGDFITERIGKIQTHTSGYWDIHDLIVRIPPTAVQARLWACFQEWSGDTTNNIGNINAFVVREPKGVPSKRFRNIWFAQADGPLIDMRDDPIILETGDVVETWCMREYQNLSRGYLWDGNDGDTRFYFLANTSRRFYVRTTQATIRTFGSDIAFVDQRKKWHYDRRPYLIRADIKTDSNIAVLGGRFNFDAGSIDCCAQAIFDFAVRRTNAPDLVYLFNEDEDATHFIDHGPSGKHIPIFRNRGLSHQVIKPRLPFQHIDQCRHTSIEPSYGAIIPETPTITPERLNVYAFNASNEVMDFPDSTMLLPIGSRIHILADFVANGTVHYAGPPSTAQDGYVGFNLIGRDNWKLEGIGGLKMYLDDFYALGESGVYWPFPLLGIGLRWLTLEVTQPTEIFRLFGRNDGQYQCRMMFAKMVIEDPERGVMEYELPASVPAYTYIPEKNGIGPDIYVHDMEENRTHFYPPVPMPTRQYDYEELYDFIHVSANWINMAAELGTANNQIIPNDGSHHWYTHMCQVAYRSDMGGVEGSYSFMPGKSGNGTMWRDESLLAEGVTEAMLDSGTCKLQASYWLRQYSRTEDFGNVRIACLDENGHELSSCTNQRRAEAHTPWVQKLTTIDVPVGTRGVRIELVGHGSGDTTDANYNIDAIKLYVLVEK